MLATLMIITMIVLALIIWGMGQVLVGVSKLALEKQRNAAKKRGHPVTRRTEPAQ